MIPCTAAQQSSLFFTISQNLLKLMSIVSMMPLGTKVLSVVLREKNYSVIDKRASLVAQLGKNLPAMQETPV